MLMEKLKNTKQGWLLGVTARILPFTQKPAVRQQLGFNREIEQQLLRKK